MSFLTSNPPDPSPGRWNSHPWGEGDGAAEAPAQSFSHLLPRPSGESGEALRCHNLGALPTANSISCNRLPTLAIGPSCVPDQILLIQRIVYIILAQDHKSSFSQALHPVLRLSLCILLPRSPPSCTLVMLNPISVSQPCSLTEKKKSRVGSVVVPYILSSTLRRMSTASTLSSTSSGLSSGSASSDGPSSQESVPLHPHITLILKTCISFPANIKQSHLSLFFLHFSASVAVPRVIR